MIFDDELHTIQHDEFVAVCRCLGYDPTDVVSVRLTKARVTVVQVDEAGHLQTIRHQVVQGESCACPAVDRVHLRTRECDT